MSRQSEANPVSVKAKRMQEISFTEDKIDLNISVAKENFRLFSIITRAEEQGCQEKHPVSTF
jgi:hypothetical protein